jgi:hypothetical protein
MKTKKEREQEEEGRRERKEKGVVVSSRSRGTPANTRTIDKNNETLKGHTH